MNVLLPPAQSGPKGVPGAGEGAQGRHDKLDGNFAAALAETAGESGEDAVGDETDVRKPDDAGVLSRIGRRIGARGGHDAHERTRGDEATPHAELATDPSIEPRTKETRRIDHKAQAKGAAGKEPREAGEVPATPPAADPAQGAAAAREALAVLAVDLTGRPERAAVPELAAAARKGTGPRGVDASALGADRAGMADIGDEVEVDEELVLPVRVVRQEKHFQAAGVEARRWQIAQDAFDAGRAAPTGEMPKSEPSDAVQRTRPAMAAALARAAEPASPVVGPVAPTVAIEVAPGAVGLQIADRLQEALTAPGDSAKSFAQAWGPGFEPDTRQTFAPALRVIKLQLNPAELGAVTIVVSGNEKGLSVELAAELADTANRVDSDRGVLAARLHGAGYTVTDINVARMAGQAMDGDTREHAARHGGQQEQLLGNGARDGGGRHGGAQQAEQHADRRSGAAYQRSDPRAGPSQGAAPAPVVAGVSYAGRFRAV